jgi:hypothetical protein
MNHINSLEDASAFNADAATADSVEALETQMDVSPYIATALYQHIYMAADQNPALGNAIGFGHQDGLAERILTLYQCMNSLLISESRPVVRGDGRVHALQDVVDAAIGRGYVNVKPKEAGCDFTAYYAQTAKMKVKGAGRLTLGELIDRRAQDIAADLSNCDAGDKEYRSSMRILNRMILKMEQLVGQMQNYEFPMQQLEPLYSKSF